MTVVIKDEVNVDVLLDGLPDDEDISMWGVFPPAEGTHIWHESGEYRVYQVVLDLRHGNAYYRVLARKIGRVP
jgi:hypothetical protein